jgi:ubiquitin-protein ligase
MGTPVQSIEKSYFSVVSMLSEPNDESGANLHVRFGGITDLNSTQLLMNV